VWKIPILCCSCFCHWFTFAVLWKRF